MLKGIWGDLVQPPLPKHIHLQQFAGIAPSQVWNFSLWKEEYFTASLGNLFQGSDTLRLKTFFLIVRWKFLCFRLCPLPSLLSLGTTENTLDPFYRHLPLRDFWALIKSCLGLLQPKQTHIPHPFFHSPYHFHSPESSPAILCLSWTGEPRTGQSAPDVLSPAQSKVRIISLDLLATPFLMHRICPSYFLA